MRKRWVFLGLLAVIVAIGAIGGTVMAQETEGDDDGAESRQDVIARVAEDLDIDEDELRTAFDEARAEIRDEQIEARIDKLVDAGRITSDEGEELKTWYDDRPAVLDNGRFGRRDLGRGSGRGGRSGHHSRSGSGDGDAPQATPEATPEATPQAS